MIGMKTTRPGRIAMFLGIALFLTGLTSGANLLVFLSMVILGAFLFSAVLGIYSLTGLAIEARPPESAIKGEPFIAQLKVHSSRRLPGPPVLFSFYFGRQTPPVEWAIPGLSAGTGETFHLNFHLKMRGRFQKVRLVQSLTWPFFLLQLSRSRKIPFPICVYPRPEKVRIRAAAIKARGSLQPSDYIATHTKGYGGLFYGVREYQSGDALRFIHWPLTARHGNLMIKEYEDTGQVYLTSLVIDDTHPEARGDPNLFEKMVDTTAGLLRFFTSKKMPVALCTTSGTVLRFREGMDARTNLKLGMEFLLDLKTCKKSRAIPHPGLPSAFNNDVWMVIRPQPNPAEEPLRFPMPPSHCFVVRCDLQQPVAAILNQSQGRQIGAVGEEK